MGIRKYQGKPYSYSKIAAKYAAFRDLRTRQATEDGFQQVFFVENDQDEQGKLPDDTNCWTPIVGAISQLSPVIKKCIINPKNRLEQYTSDEKQIKVTVHFPHRRPLGNVTTLLQVSHNATIQVVLDQALYFAKQKKVFDEIIPGDYVLIQKESKAYLPTTTLISRIGREPELFLVGKHEANSLVTGSNCLETHRLDSFNTSTASFVCVKCKMIISI